MSAVGRAWRLAATALAFAVFGGAALLLSVTAFPLLSWSAADDDQATRRVQRVIGIAFRAFAGFAGLLRLIEVEIRGEAALSRPGVLVVANHPSLLDVVLIAARMPQADCIVKQQLLANPFLRRAVRGAGYVSNAAPDGLIDDCAGRLRRGRSLLVFPQGTRSPDGTPFQRGAARIALASGCDIVPVRVRCEPPLLAKGDPWHRVPPVRPRFVIEVGDPISAAAWTRSGESTPLAARRLTQWLERRLALPPADAVTALPPLPSVPAT